MEVVEARDPSASTIVAQRPKGNIYKAFSDPIFADAICDRLFRATIDITIKGESRHKGDKPKP